MAKGKTRSKKTASKKELYFTIINHVKNNNCLPSLSISKQSRNYYVSKLKEQGVLIRKGYGTWEVDIDKFEQKRFIKQVKKQHKVASNIRGHGFHFRVKIPKIPSWYRRKEFLSKKKVNKKKIPFIETPLSKSACRIIVRKHKVWLWDNVLVIYCPKNKSFYSDSAKTSKKKAMLELENVLNSIENLMGISLKIENKYVFRVSKQHYGKIKDTLAKEINKRGEKVTAFYDGKPWLTIDKSLNVDETETLHPKYADKHMDKVVVPFFNDLLDFRVKTGETMKPSDLFNMIGGVTNNQKVFDANMMSHIDAVKELAEGVKELRKEIKRLRR